MANDLKPDYSPDSNPHLCPDHMDPHQPLRCARGIHRSLDAPALRIKGDQFRVCKYCLCLFLVIK